MLATMRKGDDLLDVGGAVLRCQFSVVRCGLGGHGGSFS